MRTARPFPLLITAGIAAVLLTGCANPLEQIVQQGTEQFIEDAVENETGVDIDVDAGGGATIADDFPAGLPTPDGSLISSMKIDETWMLSYEVPEDTEADELAAWFTANGYTELAKSDYGQMRNWVFENDTYSVMIAVMIDDVATVQYSVSTRATS